MSHAGHVQADCLPADHLLGGPGRLEGGLRLCPALPPVAHAAGSFAVVGHGDHVRRHSPAGCALQGAGDAVGTVFREAGDMLGTSSGLTAGEAWNLAVDQNIRRTAFTQEDRAILRSFGEALGSSDRAEQHKHITLTTYHLRQEEEKAERERQKNERIWKYGGFLVGIGIVLLLL